VLKVVISRLILCVFGLAVIACTESKNSETLFPVTEILHKQPLEVEKIAGKPDSVYTIRILGKSIYCQYYKPHNVEIQYPDGAATDIVVYDLKGVPFNQTALQRFGIKEKLHPSDYKKDRYIRWTDTKQFSAISIYNPRLDSLNNIRAFTMFFKANKEIL
jgi:hypothetical protein